MQTTPAKSSLMYKSRFQSSRNGPVLYQYDDHKYANLIESCAYIFIKYTTYERPNRMHVYEYSCHTVDTRYLICEIPAKTEVQSTKAILSELRTFFLSANLLFDSLHRSLVTFTKYTTTSLYLHFFDLFYSYSFPWYYQKVVHPATRPIFKIILSKIFVYWILHCLVKFWWIYLNNLIKDIYHMI